MYSKGEGTPASLYMILTFIMKKSSTKYSDIKVHLNKRDYYSFQKNQSGIDVYIDVDWADSMNEC